MSMVMCSCGWLISVDDDPECYYDGDRVVKPRCQSCREEDQDGIEEEET